MKRVSLGFASVAMLALVSACETVDSEDVMTDGVYAGINAVSTGNGKTTVEARLRTGGSMSNTFLELVGDDKLVATLGEESKDMSGTGLFGGRWYQTEFDTDAAGTEIVVAFERKVDESAPNSTMTLPAPFEVTGPTAQADFSRDSDDIVITWEPSGSSDKPNIFVDGSCVQAYKKELDSDSGSFTLEAGKLEAEEDEESDSCSLKIEVVMRRAGELDPAYGEGGAIWAEQKRSRKVTSKP